MTLVEKRYSLGEEIFNSVSHGVGTIFGIVGCTAIVIFAYLYGNAWTVASCAVYGATLIILYTMSTLYHSITNRTAKHILQIFDHCTIFLLIAGTYTPYTLVTMRGPVGWTIFGVVWACAVLGIILNAIDMRKFKKFSMVCYVLSGWTMIFAVKYLFSALPKGGIILLFAGGIAYTLGIIFYKMKRYKYMHSIWHLFVLLGSVLQYFSILFYVVPNPR